MSDNPSNARRQAELSDRARVNMRLFFGVFVLLLAPAGAFMPSWGFLLLVATSCAVQVAFDMRMAPLVADHEVIHEGAQDAINRASVLASPTRPHEEKIVRRDVGEALRKGIPTELRRDLYFHFMEGSWKYLLASMAMAYVLINALFACLYVLEPEGVTGLAGGSFLDAFYFSVQTLSTIGYGAMSPTSAYANVIVTVEAAVGILGLALVTGLIFAKASRPHTSVLFSNVCVIGHYDGQPTLVFRAGNARGNDIVEANVHVAVLMDEVDAEGHRIRRIHDLALRRRSTRLFALSWTVFHPLDERSPLANLTADSAERIASMIVTLTGYDATYAHQTHARHIYYPEDLRFGERFVDVISRLDDGRMLVHYDRFHLTEPELSGHR